MPMQTLSFTVKLDIPGTTDLKPPQLAADVKIDMDTSEDHERALWAYYKKHFEKKLKKVLEAQIKRFAEPLKSMQKEIDQIKSDHKKLTNSKDLETLAAQCKSSATLAKAAELKARIKDLQDYLGNAVKNIEKQQVLVWQTAFEKEAKAEAVKKIKKDIKWKKIRTVIGIVIVGTLVVGAAALAIAGSVASFGALPAALGIIGIASASLAGVSALAQTGKKIKANLDLEKAAITKISADLEDIATHLGKTSSKIKGLPKHLDDASRFHTLRGEEMKKTYAKMVGLDQQLIKLRAGLAEVQKLDVGKGTKDVEKKIQKLEKDKKTAQANMQRCLKRDAEMDAVLKKARQLVGNLQQIDFTGPRSMGDSLARYKNFDSVMGAVDMVNAVAGGANTLAGALP